VWFDAFVTNIDRSPRNTNMLLWHRKLWLIDHGAALYFHHGAGDFAARSADPFPQVKDHVLLAQADAIEEAGRDLAPRLTPAALGEMLALVPDAWLGDDPAARRAAYTGYLAARLAAPRPFIEEALRARRALHL
jgi:hypothetical protein